MESILSNLLGNSVASKLHQHSIFNYSSGTLSTTVHTFHWELSGLKSCSQDLCRSLGGISASEFLAGGCCAKYIIYFITVYETHTRGFGYKGKRKKVVGNRKKDVKILENITITEDLVSNSKILLVFF